MLADRRPGHLELRGDLPGRQFLLPHQLQDAQPTGSGNHLKRFHRHLTLSLTGAVPYRR